MNLTPVHTDIHLLVRPFNDRELSSINCLNSRHFYQGICFNIYTERDIVFKCEQLTKPPQRVQNEICTKMCTKAILKI